MALQFSITAIGTMIVQSSLNLLGSMYIASYSATSKIQNIVMQVYMALGAALATYAGQNYGAGKVDRIKKGLNVSIGVTAVYSIVIMVVAFFWLPSFVKIFVADPTGELRAIAEQMFHISLWFYFPLGLFSYIEIHFRVLEMGWCRCLEVCLNYLQGDLLYSYCLNRFSLPESVSAIRLHG